MLAAVKGYYDGNQIVIDEDVDLSIGQEVIVTILEKQKQANKKVDLKKYMGRGEKMFLTDAQDYIWELRDTPCMIIPNKNGRSNQYDEDKGTDTEND